MYPYDSTLFVVHFETRVCIRQALANFNLA
jgi:hypothetical protein